MDEVGRLGTHGEHGLGTDVDEVAGDGLEAELPAEPVASLEDADARRGQRVEHLEGCAQTRDATPHDDDVGPGGDGLRGHVASLSRVPCAPDATLDGRHPAAVPATPSDALPIRDRIETRHRELRRHAGRPSASSTPTTGPTKESPCAHRPAPPADSALPQRRSH